MRTKIEILCRMGLVLFLYWVLRALDAPTWAALIGSLIYGHIAMPDGFSVDKEPQR